MAVKSGENSVLDLLLRAEAPAAVQETEAPAPSSGLKLFLSANELHEMAQRYSRSVNRFETTRNELRASVKARSEQLATTKKHLAAVLDSISDGIISFNEFGRIESFSRSAQVIFGCSEGEAVGTEIGRFFGADFLEQGICREPTETICTRASGLPIRVEMRAKHVITDTGYITVLTVRDITDVKYTQQLLKEQAFLLENSHSFMLTFDRYGNIEWCNPCFERLTGFRLDELIGRKPGELLSNRFSVRPLLRQLSMARANESAFKAELEICHANGRHYWVSVEGHPMVKEDGSLEKFVTLGVDITERKKNEAMHVDFISMVSHELRTPLTVVSGAFDALSWSVGGELSETHQELVDMGLRNCEHLTMLIEDLIDVNKLEAGTVRFQSQFMDIEEPVDGAISTISRIAQDKQITVRTNMLKSAAVAFIDPQRLRQVVINLLSNAVKFSPAQSTITVSLERDNDDVVISVKDEGPGIPEDFQPRLFQKFSRDATVEANGTDGFGLGLCISKGLVEQMSGSIDFETSPYHGTTFRVRFAEHNAQVLLA
ncbi:MAG: ATP-binding protein [Burkholderiaceae bacterium]